MIFRSGYPFPTNITSSHVLRAWGAFLESRGNFDSETNIEIKN